MMKLWGAWLCFAIFVGSDPALAAELKPSKVRVPTERKPVSVLQKRYFKKALRPELGLIFGNLLNEAYTETEKRGVRLGLFFNEWIGMELQYIDTSVTASNDKEALDRLKFKKANPSPEEDPDTLVSPEPEVNKIHSLSEATVVFAPFYGKLSVANWFIIYTDFYTALGAASLKTDQGNKTALTASVGQRFYVFKSLSFRIDFRNHSFTETQAERNKQRNVQSYDLGVSWFFL